MGMNPKQMIKSFFDITKGYVEAHSEDATIKMIKAFTTKMGTVIEKIDKYLKTKDINVGDIAQKGKEKATQIKGKLIDAKSQIKEKGLKGFVKEKTASISGKISSAFSTDTEGANAPPEGGGKDTKGNPFDILLNPLKLLRVKITELTEVNKDALDNDKKVQEGEGEEKKKVGLMEKFRIGLAKSRKSSDARAKEVEEEKKNSKVDKNGKKGGGGIFGGIISAIGAAAGFLVKALPMALSRLLSFAFGKAVGGMLGRLTPVLARLAGGAAMGLGSGLAAGGSMIAAGASSLAGAAGFASVGAAALAAAPFVLGAIAVGAVAYGGYYLYKEHTKNDTGDGITGDLTKLRLLMYGYNDTIKAEYNKLFALENILEDYIVPKNGQVTFKNFDKAFREKICDVFEVGATQTDKFKVLNSWFMDRFIPAFGAFMTAFYQATKVKYIDDLSKLTPQENYELATKLVVPVKIFDNSNIPYFPTTASPVNKEQVDSLLALIKKNTQDAIGKDITKSPEVVDAELKKKTEDELAAQKLVNKKLEDNNKPTGGVMGAKIIKSGEQPPIDNPPPAAPELIGPTDKPPPTPPLDKPTGGVMGAKIIKSGEQPPIDRPAVAPPALVKPSTDTKSEDTKIPATVTTESEPPPKVTPTLETKKEEKTKESVPVGEVKKATGALVSGNRSLEGIKSNVPKEKIFSLDPNVFTLFTGMAKEYKELTGKDLLVTEAFRTRADQAALYKKYGKGRAAPPGSSLHEHGLAIDVDTPDNERMEKLGLLRKYGFTRPVGGETWHLEPAGVSLNAPQARDNKSVREARILSSPGRGGGGYGTIPKKSKGGRNVPLQKKLFDASVGTAVDVEKLKKDQAGGVDPSSAKPEVPLPKDDKSGSGGGDPVPATPSKPPEIKTESTKLTSEDGLSKDPGGEPPTTPTKNDSELPSTDKANKPNNGTFTGNDNLKPEPKNESTGSVEDIIRKAAKMVGVNPDTMVTFAKVESSLRTGIGNTKSSAKGLFQIVGPTWKYLVATYGPKYGISRNADPANPEHNALMGASYAKENLAAIGNLYKKAGLSEETALYLAHHFGPSGGKRIIKAYIENPDVPVRSVVSEASLKSNAKELGNKTVKEYIGYLNEKLGKASTTSSDSYATGKPQTETPGIFKGTDKSSVKAPIPPKPQDEEQYIPKTPTYEDTNEDGTTKRDEFGRPVRSVVGMKDMFKDYVPEKDDQLPTDSPKIGTVVGSKDYTYNPTLVSGRAISDTLNNTVSNIAGQTNGVLGSFKNLANVPQNLANNISGQIGQMGGSISKGISGIFNGFGSPQSPSSIHPRQPEGILSLDKTESLLTGIGDTLGQIRVILESIDKKSGMQSQQPQSPTSQPTSSPPEGQEQPVVHEKSSTPSSFGVSMSRRTVLV